VAADLAVAVDAAAAAVGLANGVSPAGSFQHLSECTAREQEARSAL